jgi:membrane protease YdiL (CAAX protease family)
MLGRKLLAWWVLVGGLILLAFSSAATAPEDQDTSEFVYDYSFGIVGIVVYLLILGIVLLIARGLDWREAFALRNPSSWKAAGGLTVGLFVAVYIVAIVLEAIFHAGEEQGLDPSGWQSDRAGAFVLSVLAIGVVGPISEEMTFRGLGYYLLDQFGPWAAIGVTGIAFALAHGIVVGLPVFFVIGAGLAFLRYRTSSIIPAILVHMAFNSLQLVVGVLG